VLVACSSNIGVIAGLSGCEIFEKQRQPIGYWSDENGRPCATYEIKKEATPRQDCPFESS